jgi:oligopeptide/dipeptide ABC transporter ATP-binding protein
MTSTESSNNRILRIEGLKKYFPIRRGFFQRITGWIKAVDQIYFEIERGQTLGLVGESGCSKTTVARLILKLLKADGGKIEFKGQDITFFSDKEMKPFRKEIQIIFQDPYGSLNPRMTVGQSIAEGIKIAGIRRQKEKNARLENLLKMVGMSPEISDRYPHEFSGGQRQRIGIARALSVDPSLIICDEPISALDVSIQAQIINLLKDLQDQLGLAYLFISHDLNVVGYLCNYVAVMYRGHIMEYAPTDELFAHPQHPYTHILLDAIPDPQQNEGSATKMLPKEPPEVRDPPAGCNFQKKCPLAEPRCRDVDLFFEKVADEHFVRCWKVAPNGTYRYFP